MRTPVLAILLTIACSSPKPHAPERAPAAVQAPTALPGNRPLLVVLGTFHMEADGSDFLGVKPPDVLAPERQRELDQLVELLARFRPTKIALEKPLGDTTTRDHYHHYLAGDYTLSRNEVDQLGFRLARALHHADVYPIDWRNGFDLSPVLASAGAHGQTAILGSAIGEARAYATELQQHLSRPLVDALRFVNDLPRATELHQLYLRLLQIGKADDYAAADLLSRWFERNLKMTANAIRLADRPDERVLFLVGSGHLHLVREFAAQSGAFTVVPATELLGRGPTSPSG